MVFGVALWINMMAVQYGSLTVTMLVFTTFAEPLLVITNALIVLLLVFCFTNIFALLFTITAYTFTPKHLRPQGHRNTMLKATLLIPLLIAITCYCLVFVASSYMMNGRVGEMSVMSVIGSGLVPVTIGAVMFMLKKVILKVLETPLDSTDHNRTLDESTRLLPGEGGVNTLTDSKNEQLVVICSQRP
jgi:hypothetical protein